MADLPAFAPGLGNQAINDAHGGSAGGLATDEARRRLEKFGPNAMPDTAVHPVRRALDKLWAPVPWMLEAAIVLQLALGDDAEAAVIAGLLVSNAALGFMREGRAQATLAALKSRLAMTAPVRRDGRWAVVPAAGLVPGDVVKLSLGGVVAADVRLVSGEVLLDQSMLTGESVPIEAGPGLHLCRPRAPTPVEFPPEPRLCRPPRHQLTQGALKHGPPTRDRLPRPAKLSRPGR